MDKIISPSTFKNVKEALSFGEYLFENSDLYFGHGTDNAWDEAVSILIHVLGLPPTVDKSILKRSLSPKESNAILALFKERLKKIPAPYLTHCAFFHGLPFYVDESVIIPRSPIGEFIKYESPFIKKDKIYHVLDLCCGTACLAILASEAFPKAQIIASDISDAALKLAQKNIDYLSTHPSIKSNLKTNITLVNSDLFSKVPPINFDLIITNPPYVNEYDLNTMPQEFHAEPRLALEAGKDGLDKVRTILKKATSFLSEEGILVVEVGNSEEALIHEFPDLPFIWLEFEQGGEGVFLLHKKDLKQHFMLK